MMHLVQGSELRTPMVISNTWRERVSIGALTMFPSKL
jgi:hypothetical protein